MEERTYIAIDLKSFYASVECADRGLDPLTTNLVVADTSRTEKTICLAVSPSLKSYHIPGRARLFEVIQKVREINLQRLSQSPYRHFTGKSYLAPELLEHPEFEIDYLIAPPRMARYMEVSSQIYGIYLRYISPDDIHAYSIDEVFIDATQYLRMYRLTARQFTMKLVREVLSETGITATAGIGPNLFLCKVAMDIVAKKIPADKDGVRIAELDEMGFRRQLWNHRPLTDFWRIGHGYAEKLESSGMMTLGDVARMSVVHEDLLYRLFGVNAELLIDHAWGWEPCTIAAIKSYRPGSNSLSSGQVLQNPYEFSKARLVAREMADLLVLDLVEKRLVTDQMVLTVCYDIENLTDPGRRATYQGTVHLDHYGRAIPKEAHGSINLERQCSSTAIITDAVARLFDRIVNPNLLVRKIYVVANHVVNEELAKRNSQTGLWQPDLFTDYAALEAKANKEKQRLERERRGQLAVIEIRKRLGKNAILKGMNLDEGSTAKERNQQIGGHHV